MGVIVDPDTGALVATDIEKARVDARMRVLTFVGSRPILQRFGTNYLDVLSEEPGALAAAPSILWAVLSQSTYYTVVDIQLSVDEERVIVVLTVRLPDGTILTFTVDPQPPDIPLSPVSYARSQTEFITTWVAPSGHGDPIASYDIRYRPVGDGEWTTIEGIPG